MATLSPLQVANVISTELSVKVPTLGRYLSSDDPLIMDWSDRLEAALKGRGGRANVFATMAGVAHLQGDLDLAERFFTRAEGAGATKGQIAMNRCAAYQALGFFTRSLPYVRDAFSIEALSIGVGLPMVAGTGAFGIAHEFLEAAERAQLDLDYVEDIEEIRKIAALASESKIPDEAFSSVLDVAGEILREQKLLWLGHAPDFSFDDEMNLAGIRWRIAVSPEDAADMSFELIKRLVALNLDSIPLTVGFIGIEIDEAH